MDVTSQAVLGSESLGLFTYGVLNRVLIVTGLHHIINNIAWFLLGDYNGVTGDLKRFFAGDPSAGAFMSGFFPVMMFGLPGACLAMYRTSLPPKRKAVGGMLFSMALTSFLTGVTEPIEFSFMFLAPLLYAIMRCSPASPWADALARRASRLRVLGGTVRLRAQLSRSRRVPGCCCPWAWCTSRCTTACSATSSCASISRRWGASPTRRRSRRPRDRRGCTGLCVDPGAGFGEEPAFGRSLHHAPAADRVRCGVADEPALKALGSRGVLKLADGAVQVVVGPVADQLASEIRAALKKGGGAVPQVIAATSAPTGDAPPADARLLARVLEALGGRGNIAGLELRSSRLCVSVREPTVVDETALAKSVRALARPTPNTVHLVVGPGAPSWFDGLKLS
jgi:PTS system N-acetylglucosamine-specific IIC component